MPNKAKIVTVSVLILLGAALFYYCAVLYPTESAAQGTVGSQAVCASGSETPEKATAASSTSTKSSSSQKRSRPRSGAT